MRDDAPRAGNAEAAAPAARAGRFLGSLRDALLAAARTAPELSSPPAFPAAPAPEPMAPLPSNIPDERQIPSAAEAARQARGSDLSVTELELVEPQPSPAMRVVRPHEPVEECPPARTQLVRGNAPVRRGPFQQDPVVGWLVVVGGPGLGNYRPVFEGNNAIGRAPTQRIPIDFGDEAISSEEQAYIRYDSSERSFLFVPNLAKTNVVSVNDARPTAAVELQHMDVITIGRTQLVFIPFCGAEFDWSEIIETHD